MIGERTPLACCFRPLAENSHANAIFARPEHTKNRHVVKSCSTSRGTVHAGGVRSPEAEPRA